MQATTRYSDILDSVARRQQEEVRRSILGNLEASEELWDVWHKCREENWDGYNAVPVDQETYRAAYRLIESLPLGFPRPSIGAEPDGQLTLEWFRTPSRCLSVSVDPEGWLHYAGLYGANKRFGTIAFFGTTPDDLIRLVKDL